MQFIPELEPSLLEKTVHLQPALLMRYQWRCLPNKDINMQQDQLPHLTFFFHLQEVNLNSDTNTVSKATQHSLEDVVDKWTSKCDEKSWRKIRQWVFTTSMTLSSVTLNKNYWNIYSSSPQGNPQDIFICILFEQKLPWRKVNMQLLKFL